MLRRKKDTAAPAPVAAGPTPDLASIAAHVTAVLGRPGWGPIELRPGDRVVQPPPTPAVPPMTGRAGALAVRFRALQLAAEGGSLTGDEARGVLGRVAHTWRRVDGDELGRLRAAGTVLESLQTASAPVPVALEVARWASDRYGLGSLPIAPLEGLDIPPIAAGYLAAFSPAVERGLELRDAIARGAVAAWTP